MGRNKRDTVVGLAALVAGLLSVVGFHDAGRQYQNYQLEYAGVVSIVNSELTFYAWYLAFGTLAVLFLSVFFAVFWPGDRPEQALKRLLSGKHFVAAAMALLAVETLCFQRWVLQYAPVADDEGAYAFVAQTLLKGRVVNPSPGDIGFFWNQFVVVTPSAWYGKYPVGHPALLALGEAVGLRFLVVPLLSVLVLFLTWRVGRRLFPGSEGPLAALLLLASPHFVFMGASQLSHTSESLCLMGGLLALLVLRERDRVLWAAAAGACFAWGVLVRPLPGVLLLPVVAAWVWFGLAHLAPKRRLTHLLAGAAPVVAAGAVLLLVNSLQTGDATRSGYDQFHQGPYFQPFGTGNAAMSVSLVGAILRENFWLFGWPLSLVFLPFARRVPNLALVWGLAGAVLFYRVLLPKTVVATLGPMYLTEMVPLLALASAGGILAARAVAERVFPGKGARGVAGFVAASASTAALCFLPVEIRNIHRSSQVQQRVYRLIEQRARGKVLVFAATLADPEKFETWAYFPPNPSPDLDDPVVFVRVSPLPEQNYEFWKRRFPDRAAFLFRPELPAGEDFVEVRSPRDFPRARP